MATLSRFAAGVLLLWAALPAVEPARADGSVEAAVKATYIVKFTHYVVWPAAALGAATSPIVVCVVGRDPFGATIDAAARGELVEQHPVIVRRLATIDRGSGCNVAFLAGNAATGGLSAVDGAPILTVTDAAETRVRGIFHFRVRGGHVGFDVDDLKASRAGLTISSRLLSIALSVSSRGGRP